jgi:hypothetical protein
MVPNIRIVADSKRIYRRAGLYLTLYITVTALAACAPQPVTYAKSGAVPGEWEQDRAACMMEAAQKVPANNQYAVIPGSDYVARNCNHSGKDCSAYDSYSPPQLQTTDTNSDLRQAVFQACLAKRGWIVATPSNR